MDKVKYIINCNGKKITINSEEKYEIFKQKNQNYNFIEKERTKENLTINIIKVDMAKDNNPIPLPDPNEPTIKELAKTVNGLTCTVDALTNTNKEIMKIINGLSSTVNTLTNTNKEIMDKLSDFIKEQREFNKKQDERWERQEIFNKEQRKFNSKQDTRWEKQEKFNKRLVKLNNLKI